MATTGEKGSLPPPLSTPSPHHPSSLRSRTSSHLPPPLLLTTPTSLALHWSTVKDYNLRSGIPNLEQLLSGKGRPPLDSHNFSVFVSRENPVGSLLLEFYGRVTRFENQCAHHELHYPLPPPTEDPTTGITSPPNLHLGRTLLVNASLSNEEASAVQVLATEAQEIIQLYLDPRSPQFVGCPTEFLWRARAGLEAPGQPWVALFSPSKQHAFNALNSHFYQEFVDYSFRRNLSPLSGQLCLITGSLLFTAGITLALSLIFHATPSVPLRITMLPLVYLGCILLLAAYTRFLPFLGMMSSREISFRKQEPLIDPLVCKAHRRLAYIHLAVGLGTSLLLTLLFCLIPGNHLLRHV